MSMVDFTPIAPNSAEPEVAANANFQAFKEALEALDGSALMASRGRMPLTQRRSCRQAARLARS
jgi:hypothetical protein